MLCALIMAGGKGTRFWPLSTEEKPKQFLSLIGEETMIQMTVNRIKPIIPIERIFVCTGEKYVDLVREQLPELDVKNIIVEPEGRNTAPCIALSAFLINRYYKNSTMVVLPSDHLIGNENKFLDIIKDADQFLDDYQESIITLGMTPNRPETGYGYIKCSNDKVNIKTNSIVKVERFVEKPDKQIAEQYIYEGSYLWNGGMFLWKNDYILSLVERLLPNTYKALKFLQSVEDKDIKNMIKEHYSETDNISIDFGIMEHAENIYVIPSDINWDDVGSWEAINRYREKDKDGNILIGKVNSISSSNNLVVTTNQNVIINGLSNIYVIENEGQIVIGCKDGIQNIKELKALIN